MTFNILHLTLPNLIGPECNIYSKLQPALFNKKPEILVSHRPLALHMPSQCNPAGLRSRLHTLLPKQGSQMILPQESSSSIHKLTETPTPKPQRKTCFTDMFYLIFWHPHSLLTFCFLFLANGHENGDPKLPLHSCQVARFRSVTPTPHECRDRCTTVIPL